MFYKLIRLLVVLVSLLYSFTLFANECVKFRETLKQHSFWEPPQSENYIGYGFIPSYKYDEQKDDWDYVFDEHGLKIQQIYFNSPSWDAALLGKEDQKVNSRNPDLRITHIDEAHKGPVRRIEPFDIMYQVLANTIGVRYQSTGAG